MAEKMNETERREENSYTEKTQGGKDPVQGMEDAKLKDVGDL